MLSASLLDEFLDRLHAVGAFSVVERFQPGITDREIDEALAQTGLAAPEEARVLWRWRNGQPPWHPDREPRPTPFQFGSFHILPVVEAATIYLTERKVATQLLGDGDIPDWYDECLRPLLPVVGSHRPIACQTDVPAGLASPAHTMRWEDEEFATPIASSLGALVTKWIDAIDTGNWTYDRQTEFWAVANPLRPDGSPDPALE